MTRDRIILALFVLNTIGAIATACTARNLALTAREITPIAKAQVQMGEIINDVAGSLAETAHAAHGAVKSCDTTPEPSHER